MLAALVAMHDYARMASRTELAQTLRDARTSRGLTQQKVATALEVPFTYVSRWERAEVRPDSKHLEKLARFYELDLVELIRMRNEAPSGRSAATSPAGEPEARHPADVMRDALEDQERERRRRGTRRAG
ncbi:helix-turn-helix domain-containing protein [Miltoncostaea marina]|uniref:helix-turn-helix domain-containing protein n=1 Tax=Miltoncostaea marina TaxID=2843215 RepID=UPI001C3DD396|nr:helix-turn-helix transcriptional regulator [Miltoncostaea marina]